VKIKLDENVTVAAKDLFRSLAYEADSVPDEKMTGASDPVLLDACRREERVLSRSIWDSVMCGYTRQIRIPGSCCCASPTSSPVWCLMCCAGVWPTTIWTNWRAA
jgi:Domain of unknown function (DUF5615)